MSAFSKAIADLLYAGLGHLHDDRYLQDVPQQDHGGLSGLGDDDHTQYYNQVRGDVRYLRTVPQQDHGGLSGLVDDDHTQYYNQARGDARYLVLSAAPAVTYFNMLTTQPFSVGQGTWIRAVASTFLYNGYYRNTSNLNGDRFTVKVYLYAGTYSLTFNAYKGPTTGKVDVKIDTVSVGIVDLYAAAADLLYVTDIINIAVSASGLKSVEFSVNGKNAASTGHFLLMSGVQFLKTA